MGWSDAHMFLCGIISAIMTLSGFGADTWQWWVVCLAQVFSSWLNEYTVNMMSRN